MNTGKDILLVYDKACPACNYYCQGLSIRKNIGPLKIINARDNNDIIDQITERGLDIDQGMVLKIDEQFFYGSDAIHALALISSRSTLFNKVNYWIFKSTLLSSFLYPILRFSRNLLLKILGKTKINNLNKKNNTHF